MPEQDRTGAVLNTRSNGRASTLIPIILASALALGLLGWLFFVRGPGQTGLSKQDVSATAEAVDFATAQAGRQATQEAAGAVATGFAQGTATAITKEQEAAASQTAVAATAEARATAEAPPTLTAQAVEFEAARTQADAEAQALDKQATRIYGPKSGQLEQTDANQVTCEPAEVALRDFVAEIRFHNPATGLSHSWDYGIIFSNSGDDTDYRLILDSTGHWTLNLHSEGYDISNRDSTQMLALSKGGTNTLKLYVTGDTTLLYINGQYVDTLDLNMFGQGPASGTLHDVSACAGISKEDAATGTSTGYEDFTVWALP